MTTHDVAPPVTAARQISTGPLAPQAATRTSFFKVAPGDGAVEAFMGSLDDDDDKPLIPETPLATAGADELRMSANASRLSGSARLSGTSGRFKAPLVPVGPMGMTQAERGIIGALLVDNNLYDIVAGQLTAEDFSDAAAGKVFEAISDILDGKVDGITVAEPFTVSVRKGIAKVAGLQKLQQWSQDAETDPDKVSSRARMVHEDAMHRRMTLAVAEAGQLLVQDSTVQEKANQLASILEKGSAEIHKTEIKSASDFAIAAVSKLAEQAQAGKQITGIPMGFKDLDLVTAGLQPGQLIVIAARPAIGKTAFALSALLNIAEAGYPGLFISLEMPGEEVAKRTLSHISRVDAHKMRLAALNADEWERVIAAAEHLKGLPMQFNDVTSVSLRALRAIARREHKEGRLAVLVVDYLQIMDTNEKLGREQQIAELSRGLKKLAMELKIPVIALSQLNRDIEKRVNKRPMLSDLRESGAIEQDADVIMFIDRDLDKKNSKTLGMAEIIVGKQRSGRLADISVEFDDSTTHFRDRQAHFTALPL